VQPRFDAAASPALSEPMLERLRGLAGRRMTAEGVIVIRRSALPDASRCRQSRALRLQFRPSSARVPRSTVARAKRVAAAVLLASVWKAELFSMKVQRPQMVLRR